MKTFRIPVSSAGLAVLAVWLASANAPVAVAAETSPRASVSPGVAEVEKLVRAKIGDDTIVAFVAASGIPYRLTAADLIALKQQGVSDRVLDAMLARQKASYDAPSVPVAAAQAAVAPAAPAPAPAPAQPVYAAPGQTVYPGGPAPVQAPTTIVVQQPPPTVVQPVYYEPAVVPYYRGSPYGYYGPYWGPSLSLSVGLGRGWGIGYGGYYGGYWGGSRGGYHGGYRGGGGGHGHR